MTGTEWNLPREQALAATGPHLDDCPGHDVVAVRVDGGRHCHTSATSGVGVTQSPLR